MHAARVESGTQDGEAARGSSRPASAGLAAAVQDRDPGAVLALQSMAGNRATRALCQTPARAGDRRDAGAGARPREADQRGRAVSRSLRDAVVARRSAAQSVAPPCPTPPPMSDAERAATMTALCMGGDEVFTGPPVVEFTPRERRLVMATLMAARSRASQATNNLSRGDRYLNTLAARFLHEDAPNLEELAITANRIHEALVNTPFERGTCANELCTKERDGHREGAAIMADADVDHVTHATDTITICPFFFDPSHSISELVRTWLHEAGHVAHIDDPPPGQPYVHPPNCETQRGGDPTCRTSYDANQACPGGDKHNVDNWAYFIEHAANA